LITRVSFLRAPTSAPAARSNRTRLRSRRTSTRLSLWSASQAPRCCAKQSEIALRKPRSTSMRARSTRGVVASTPRDVTLARCRAHHWHPSQHLRGSEPGTGNTRRHNGKPGGAICRFQRLQRHGSNGEWRPFLGAAEGGRGVIGGRRFRIGSVGVGASSSRARQVIGFFSTHSLSAHRRATRRSLVGHFKGNWKRHQPARFQSQRARQARDHRGCGCVR
jgi:hypothetical protein